MDLEPEERLHGGNVADAVVRIGQTVYKPATPATPGVEALLRHLEATGFNGAPHWVGQDDHGRYGVEYVPGPMAHDLGPLSSDDLHRVGRMLCDLHDATAGFVPPPDAHWDVVLPAPGGTGEILICHNDVAPWNLVLGDTRWVLIDWDGSGPSTRLWDLAYAAHGFVVFTPDGDPAVDAPRLRALVDGYGLDHEDRDRLPELLVPRTRGMFDLLERGARTGDQPWARLHAEGHADHWGPTADYLERHLAAWHVSIR